MSDGLKKLQAIGAQKIYETTHISKQHVQAILHESFEDISKIQFIGFISILEREYNIELDDLKSKGLNYFSEFPQKDVKSETVFVTSKKKKNYSKFYIFFVLVIFVVVAIFSIKPYSLVDVETKSIKLEEINNSAINSAKKIIIKENISSSDINQSTENNITNIKVINILELKEVKKEPIKEEVKEKLTSSLIIKPKNRVWMGYINIETHKKHQTVFKNKFTFDTNKDWIIVFGHGYINLEIDGKVKSFNTKSNLRFLYKDNKLTKIDLKEFKRLNRGKTW